MGRAMDVAWKCVCVCVCFVSRFLRLGPWAGQVAELSSAYNCFFMSSPCANNCQSLVNLNSSSLGKTNRTSLNRELGFMQSIWTVQMVQDGLLANTIIMY